MEIVKRFILKNNNGSYINIRLEKVKSITQALRFKDDEEYQAFMNSIYAPKDKENYFMQEIEITYEEIENGQLQQTL